MLVISVHSSSDEDTGPPNQDESLIFSLESLDLPPLPADRSNFDVHGALEDDKVKTKECYALCVSDYIIRIMTLKCIISIILGFYVRFVNVVLYVTS